MRRLHSTVKKGHSHTVELAFEDYKGHNLLDLRVIEGEYKTKRGICAGLTIWREILPLLAAAIEEADKLADSSSDLAKEVG